MGVVRVLPGIVLRGFLRGGSVITLVSIGP